VSTSRGLLPLLLAAFAAVVLPAVPASAATGTGPQPGSPEYVQRDADNMAQAYDRQTAPDGQLMNPEYSVEFDQQVGVEEAQKLEAQAAYPGRPAVTLGLLVPGAELGNPFRWTGWDGVRGHLQDVKYLNRYGALIRGRVFSPIDGAVDPDTGRTLHAPYPGLVIVPGSIQGTRGMYDWAAEDMAERGYVVLDFDAQGQGTSQSFPAACGGTSPGEQSQCGGFPFQQQANFEYGADDAVDFFWSTPTAAYAGSRNVGQTAPGADGTDAYNPYWAQFDRSRDPRAVTPGRPYRFAIMGHSLGATAASIVGNLDPRVSAIVAWDKLCAPCASLTGVKATPVVPALAVQSEYFLNTEPYYVAAGPGGASPPDPSKAPDPYREIRSGYQAYARAGVDSMLVVLRHSTHLEYTDIPYILPASRYGQDVTSHYQAAWLDKYLKHDASADGRLAATSFSVVEPKGKGVWGATPVLQRDDNLSFYFCSAWRYHAADGAPVELVDPVGDGCDAATVDGPSTTVGRSSVPPSAALVPAAVRGSGGTALPSTGAGGGAAALAGGLGMLGLALPVVAGRRRRVRATAAGATRSARR
jgi:dienelactone hydrolase